MEEKVEEEEEEKVEGGEEEKVEGREGGEEEKVEGGEEEKVEGGEEEKAREERRREESLPNATFGVRAGLGYLPQTFGASEQKKAAEPLLGCFLVPGWTKGRRRRMERKSKGTDLLTRGGRVSDVE